MRISEWSSDVCSSDLAALTDTDGSEALSISITGLPDGARLSHGVEAEPGVWEINPDDLGSLEVFPPSNSDVDFQLTVTAISAEAATGGAAIETATIDVQVNGVADGSSLAVADAAGTEDAAIALDIQAALAAIDGSEVLSVTERKSVVSGKRVSVRVVPGGG